MSRDQKKNIISNITIKSGVWYTISNFVMKGIGFLTTPIFTRLLTKEEYGDFNNFQVWTLLLLYVTSLNLDASVGRATKDFEDDQDGYVLSMISLYMVFTVICWVICTIFSGSFTSWFTMSQTSMNCMFVYLLFFPAIQLFQTLQRFRYRYQWNIATGMVISIGTSLLSVLLVLCLEDRLMGMIIGFLVFPVLVGVFAILYFARNGKKIQLDYWKYALPIVLPYIPHLLSIYLLSNLDRIMIRDICGTETMALYTLAYTCGMVITMLFNSANEAYGPWLSDKLHRKEYGVIRERSLYYVLFFAALALGITLVTPEILLIMGGSGYMEAKTVMPPVAAGCFLQFVYSLYVNVEQYEKKTVGMAIASVVTVLINFCLNAIFIRLYGYVAAAYTTYVCYFLLLIFHMCLVARIGRTEVYPNRKILLIAILSSLLIFSVTLFLEMTILRWIIILVYGVSLLAIAIKYKKTIIQLLRRKETEKS